MKELTILTRIEFEKTRDIFIDVFDQLMSSVVLTVDTEELINHIAKIQAMFRMFLVTHPVNVTSYNEEIFGNPVVSNFYFELLERFSFEIVGLSEHFFARLVKTLAEGSAACKSTSSSRLDGIDPILTTISSTPEDIAKTYLENPWFVALVLLNTQYKRTNIGKLNTRA